MLLCKLIFETKFWKYAVEILHAFEMFNSDFYPVFSVYKVLCELNTFCGRWCTGAKIKSSVQIRVTLILFKLVIFYAIKTIQGHIRLRLCTYIAIGVDFVSGHKYN